jgi:hypothetical protein
MTEFSWLIEAPGQNYLGTQEIGLQSRFYWTNDAAKALRFCSKEQADGVMMAVRKLAPDLWDFALTLGEAFPREHGYLGDAP